VEGGGGGGGGGEGGGEKEESDRVENWKLRAMDMDKGRERRNGPCEIPRTCSLDRDDNSLAASALPYYVTLLGHRCRE